MEKNNIISMQKVHNQSPFSSYEINDHMNLSKKYCLVNSKYSDAKLKLTKTDTNFNKSKKINKEYRDKYKFNQLKIKAKTKQNLNNFNKGMSNLLFQHDSIPITSNQLNSKKDKINEKRRLSMEIRHPNLHKISNNQVHLSLKPFKSMKSLKKENVTHSIFFQSPSIKQTEQFNELTNNDPKILHEKTEREEKNNKKSQSSINLLLPVKRSPFERHSLTRIFKQFEFKIISIIQNACKDNIKKHPEILVAKQVLRNKFLEEQIHNNQVAKSLCFNHINFRKLKSSSLPNIFDKIKINRVYEKHSPNHVLLVNGQNMKSIKRNTSLKLVF